ncbi:ABC transporter ATP-binding protein [Galliscardovia ingluviei]|uniref:ABC transporter ATP-binding protein n=1 Tax=Galliscardovia ingluviei TaxID=1769422 RepID=A0A8J3ANB3_9BIFI|nr:hypothetical protein [Galliscardovia ingluviei]GGI13937.1 ABC transporter ATP-binding protein [Galliscardovia ingluviei]
MTSTQPQKLPIGTTHLDTSLGTTIRTFIALRWALTRANMRASAWVIVSLVIGAIMQIGMMIGCYFFAEALPSLSLHLLGLETTTDVTLTQHGALRIASAQAWGLELALIATIVALIILLFQLMFSGNGSTLNVEQLSLFGIDDTRMQIGVFAAMLTGFPSIIGAADLLIVSSAWRWYGIGIMIVAFVCALLTLIVWVALCSMIVALVATFIRSTKSKTVYYLVVLGLFICIAQLPNILMSFSGAYQSDVADTADTAMLSSMLVTSAFSTASQICSWLPFGAAMSIPAHVVAGEFGIVILKLAISCAAVALALWVMMWCMRYTRLHAQGAQASTGARGLGIFARVPDNAIGAVIARGAVYWRRDPRLMLNFLMPVVFLVIMGAQAYSTGQMMIMWMAPILVAWFMSMMESNNVALDGTPFIFQSLSAVPAYKDRLGRAIVNAVISGLAVLVCCGVAFVVSRAWENAFSAQLAGVFTCVALSFVLANAGIAQMLAVLLPYPTASIDKPFASRQGRIGAQMLFPFISMLVTIVVAAPTAAISVAVLTQGWSLWIIGVTAIVSGVLFSALGVWLAAIIMRARELQLVQAVTNFASMR